jgi:pyruvate formate lyase activating enzyme
MKIAGLQKTTLIDYPGKVACTIFLHGCGFRCGFCYNPELVLKQMGYGFSQEEVFDFLKKRKGKLDAVCITGGEPLMTLDFEFLKKIREMGYLIKIDTNGNFPGKLKKAIEEGLVDYIAMDVKSSPKNYSKVTGVKVDIGRIEDSIRTIHKFGNYEFRTTILYKYHDAFEMRALGRWMKKLVSDRPKKFYLQGFKSGHNMIDESLRAEKTVGEKHLQELKECVDEFFEEVGIRV